MIIKDYLDINRIVLDIESTTKKDIISELASLFLNDSDVLKEGKFQDLVSDILERESVSSTGMQDGIAIPHVKSEYVNKIGIVVGISKEGKDFGSLDGEKSKIFFLIVSPKDNNRMFMKYLSSVAAISMQEDKIEELLNAKSREEIYEILTLMED